MDCIDKESWLGLIGGIFGILASLVAIILGADFFFEEVVGLYGQHTIAVIFSVVGIASPVVISSTKWSGVWMIISGLIVLITINLFGILTTILFIIGGLLRLKDLI